MSKDTPSKSLLSHLSIGDRYQRRARFLPGILTVLVLFPIGAAGGLAVGSWIPTLISGVGRGERGAPAAPREARARRRSRRSILSLPDQYTTVYWTEIATSFRSRAAA